MWTGAERGFCVEMYIHTDSIVVTQHSFRKHYKRKRHDLVPSPKAIKRWPENIRLHGIANNDEKGRPKSSPPRTVPTQTNVERVRSALVAMPTSSGRKHAASTHLSQCSWRRIVRDDLNMHPFKIQITQQLKDDNYTRRFVFCETILTMVEVDNFDIGRIWFSDEAHFDLFGNVNKQNCRYYASSQPHQHIQKPLHSPRITIWCALSSFGIIDLFFFRKQWFEYHGQFAALSRDVENIFSSSTSTQTCAY